MLRPLRNRLWQNDFTFTPDYPTSLPNLTINISNSATAIKTAALAAIKKAYLGFPVTVVEGTPGTGDDLATVLNHETWQPNAPGCGATPTNGSRSSQIDYINIMKQAQSALQIPITDAATEASALQSPTLIQG